MVVIGRSSTPGELCHALLVCGTLCPWYSLHGVKEEVFNEGTHLVVRHSGDLRTDLSVT